MPAAVFPSDWASIEVTGAAVREIETLRRLQAGLTEGYSVFHGVHWTQLEKGFSAHGEIDFLVVSNSGHVLLIQQRTGVLHIGPQGLSKRTAGADKSVVVELAHSAQVLRQKFARQLNGAALHVDALLYCPDHEVTDFAGVGLEPDQVVDASHKDALVDLIERRLPLQEGMAENSPHAEKVIRFLRNELRLTIDVSAMVGKADAWVTRVSGGLIEWVSRLSFEPYRLRITGTAGSGKTQWALHRLAQVVQENGTALYICYNRPMADYMRRALSAQVGQDIHAHEGAVQVTNFHALCDHVLRTRGVRIQWGRPDSFTQLVQQALAVRIEDQDRFDCIITDEGQDFDTEWLSLLAQHLKPNAQWVWMEDPLQNLYGQAPVALPGWVRLDMPVNYRNPRTLVFSLEAIRTQFVPNLGVPLIAACPLEAATVHTLTYAASESVAELTARGITQCLKAGFHRQDIAVVSFRGLESSTILKKSHLGPHKIRTFSGGYDDKGHAQYTQGDVLADSVYRFKGQSAPAVVLTELDFENFDEAAFRKLFVGITRARLMLVLVMSERAGHTLGTYLPS